MSVSIMLKDIQSKHKTNDICDSGHYNAIFTRFPLNNFKIFYPPCFSYMLLKDQKILHYYTVRIFNILFIKISLHIFSIFT